MPQSWVYILASRTGTLYTGVTSDLTRRVLEHRSGIRSGFASKYGCDRLVYYEESGDIAVAIAREKAIKGWTRAKKIALIEAKNPDWNDLAKHLGSRMLMPNQSMAEEDEKEARRIRLPLPEARKRE